ncbi:MAG TPA: alkene reductase [Candidatus Ozemobacteraceae bacterium]|nr:alkene reductase [Candidatus Ozemobacteraceae bacterium]
MLSLFHPIDMGALRLPNRIFMAPMTRSRATPDSRTPVPLMAEYYAQRAAAGLIISEATSVDPMGVGYAATPGIWSDEQTAGWKLVTDAVHGAGGRIFLQLWHVGRISDPSFLGGRPPVSASAIAAKGHVSLLRPIRPFPVPRALETKEIPGIIAAYRKGAANAKTAGFDGVELHGANGYLLDQFLQDSTNHRTDAYGGSRENRARLMLEVTDAVLGIWEPGQVGMHLAPRGDAHDMGDSDRLATFTYVARELGRRRLAFICTREAQGEDSIGPRVKEAFGGVYIANEGFSKETAEKALKDGTADAVAFGKLFISNPDLVGRFAANSPLNAWNEETMYSGGSKGYTDYPTLTPKS